MALAAGCAGETFDLLRPTGGGAGTAGAGAGTAGAAGRGGATNAGTGGSKGGSGGTAGRTSTGGTGGRGGTGAIGNGGTGLTSGDGGESGENAGGAGPTDCITHADCTPSLPYCMPDRNSSANHCVACVQGADCGVGEGCNFLTNACAPVCFTWEQCPMHLPFCDGELGVCVECVVDSQCGSDVCEFGECVECRSAFDCPLDAPVCDTASRCVPCTGMFQCGQYRYCDISTGRCEPLGTP